MTVWVISDTHFGHKNILTFEHEGKPLRPFKSLEEMHVTMVLRWNEVVKPQDKIYHLGDVAFSGAGLDLIQHLNGKKRLVRGNHDLYPTKRYLQYFEEIYGVRQINGIWLTHIPMAEQCVNGSRVKLNVHGHLHASFIDNPKYRNVSVEQIGYRPVALEELEASI